MSLRHATLLLVIAAARASADHTTTHEVILSIKQRNLDILEAALLAVSDPQSDEYGRHWSFEAIGSLTRDASAEAATRVWLTAHGIDECKETSPYAAFIRCNATANMWKHALDGHDFETAQDYEITPPAAMRGHLAGIFRAHRQAQPQSMPLVPARAVAVHPDAVNHTNSLASPCTKPWSCPAFLHQYYNITSASSTDTPLGSQSVFETGQYGSPKDLTQFQNTYGTPTVKVVKDVNGFLDDQTCEFLSYECSEANLDLQYLTAIGQRVPTWFWGNDKQTTFANWIAAVASTKDAPLVHSVSYGQLESQTGPDLRETFTTEVMKLGLRGVTVLVSSGDDGVANTQTRTSSGLCGYTPQWPASCPYVLSVGATQGPEEGKPEEVVCSSSNNNTFITSGGGFSEAFKTPVYQKTAVASFLANAKQNSLGPGYNSRTSPSLGTYTQPSTAVGSTSWTARRHPRP
eukprot:Hpha_TRINITY_DN16566_c1_g3::TRINITY_DN16566_c1_g3_i1::g.134515::m.134515/K01279/TPP1, CLN2; tripeptidyl-peptidase I